MLNSQVNHDYFNGQLIIVKDSWQNFATISWYEKQRALISHTGQPCIHASVLY